MKQHSSRFLNLVAETKTRIQEITVHALKEKLERGDTLHLIDVRDENECSIGCIPNSLHLSKGIIERDIEKHISDAQTPIVVYCSGGFRCALVADSLQNMGYTNVLSLAGGLSSWIEAGYPLKKAS